jgi:hypothetical protein
MRPSLRLAALHAPAIGPAPGIGGKAVKQDAEDDGKDHYHGHGMTMGQTGVNDDDAEYDAREPPAARTSR